MTSQYRVLVADDETTILDVYAAVLGAAETADGAGQELADLDSELFGEAAPVPPDLHYELTLCRQGDEAVKAVQQAVESGNPYAVAFLDVRMPPGLDGVQAAERIRAFDPNINIVIVTGYSDLHPRDIAERVRPVDKFLYCQKPIQAAELEQFAHALSAKWAVERLLRATRERLEFLLASSPAVIYSRNPRDDFAVTYVSENAGPLFGWQPEDLLHGRDFWIDSIHPHDRPHVLIGMKDVLDAGRGLMEYRVRQNDGQFRWVRDESKLVRDHNGNPQDLVGYWIDVTELKSAEEALIAAKERAELSDRAKSEFLANMSHELRTPLNAVIGFSEMIKTETLGPVGNPQYLDYAKDIHESSAHLLDVINDVLDLSKIEAGQFELREETVDLGDVLRKTARLIEERARWADLRLEVDIPTSLPALRADERALKQIVINLLSNAIKFTRAGGTIRLAAGHHDHGAIWLKVRDDGIGMKPEQIPIALAPFRQVESGLSRRFEGTGLGLPLTAAMVDLHGGTVAIDSVSGEGTTVTVELPADRVVPARDVA